MAWTIRLARLAFLAVVLSVAVGLGPTSHLRQGYGSQEAGHYDRQVAGRESQQPSKTQAPTNTHDDGVWQSARSITTTSGTSFQIGKHELRAVTIAPRRTLAAVCTRLIDEFGGTSRDRSPQHSIPLLI
jgi:hypothetical protein